MLQWEVGEMAGIIPVLVAHVWDLNWLINEKEGVGAFLKALFGYNGNPSLVEVVAYVTYLGSALWYFAGRRLALPAAARRRIA